MFKRKKFNQEVENYIIAHQQELYRLAYGYVKNSEDALDVVQESIIKAITSVDSLQDLHGLKTWVYRIVVNTALDVIRKQKRVSIYEEELQNTYASDSDSRDDEYSDLDLVQALEKLSPVDRGRIVLRYYEDLKLEDVAEILKENVNTTKNRLYATLKKLRVEIEEPIEEHIEESFYQKANKGEPKWTIRS